MEKSTRNLLAIFIVSLIVNATAFAFIPDNIPVGMKNNVVTDYTSKSNFVLTNILISVIMLVVSLINYKFPKYLLSIFFPKGMQMHKITNNIKFSVMKYNGKISTSVFLIVVLYQVLTYFSLISGMGASYFYLLPIAIIAIVIIAIINLLKTLRSAKEVIS